MARHSYRDNIALMARPKFDFHTAQSFDQPYHRNLLYVVGSRFSAVQSSSWELNRCATELTATTRAPSFNKGSTSFVSTKCPKWFVWNCASRPSVLIVREAS